MTGEADGGGLPLPKPENALPAKEDRCEVKSDYHTPHRFFQVFFRIFSTTVNYRTSTL